MSLGMGRFYKPLVQREFTEISSLKLLKEEDYTELGMSKFHRRKLNKAIYPSQD